MREVKIFLGADHAGFALKEKIKKHLEKNYNITDLGTNSTKPVDYPDVIFPVARKVSKNKNSLGIIFGGSGQGESITANKLKGIRATTYYSHNLKIIKLSKQHNDANILSLGARFLSTKQALQAVDLWIKTPFSNLPRHKRRIKKIK